MEKPCAPTRREREKKFRVELVLDAAFRVFSEKPFAKASVEEIAAAAEMSVGTLYSLFETKGEIYRALISRQQTTFYDYVNARIDGAPDPKAKIHAAIVSSFESFVKRARGWQLHAASMAGFELGTRRQLLNEARATSEATSSRVVAACQDGVEIGVFKAGVDPGLMGLTIMMIPQAYIGYVFDHMETDIMSLVPSALEAADRVVGAD